MVSGRTIILEYSKQEHFCSFPRSAIKNLTNGLRHVHNANFYVAQGDQSHQAWRNEQRSSSRTSLVPTTAWLTVRFVEKPFEQFVPRSRGSARDT